MRHYQITELLQKLEPIAATARVPAGYWIESDEGVHYETGGSWWCENCIDDTLVRLNLYTPSGAFECSPADPGMSEDSCIHCAECGATLDYSLTDCGAAAEIGHFLDNPPSGSADDIFHIVKALDALEWSADADLVADAITVGGIALAALAAETCSLAGSDYLRDIED